MKTITLELTNDLDNALNDHLDILKADGINYTKKTLIIKLMRIGLLKESAALINEGRVKL